MWKNLHPGNSAGIGTHNLRKVSLFPKPLDQGSRPKAANSLAEGDEQKERLKW